MDHKCEEFKIKDVLVIPLLAELERPLEFSTGIIQNRKATLIKIITDEGIEGFGEADGPSIIIKNMIDIYFKPLIIGESVFKAHRKLQQFITTTLGVMRLKGHVINALSGIDIALWDLKGKIFNAPVYKLLEADYKDEVQVYAAGLYFKDLNELKSEARNYVDRGFKAIKMKIGEGPKKDKEKVEIVKNEIGDDILLMVDANAGYDLTTAIRVGLILENYNVYFFEEPLPCENIVEMAELRKRISIPIASGECEQMKYGFRDLIIKKAIDIIQPDLTRAGGLTECKKIAAIAETWGKICIPHTFTSSIVGLMAAAHFAKSTPNCPFVELDQTINPLRDSLTREPLPVKRGRISVPEKAGLGIELDENQLKKFLFEKALIDISYKGIKS
jgi:D-galactarolactone cycloisomerase